jgi:hypothetical protein
MDTSIAKMDAKQEQMMAKIEIDREEMKRERIADREHMKEMTARLEAIQTETKTDREKVLARIYANQAKIDANQERMKQV